MLLEIRDLEVRYGGIRAVKGIDLEVAQGELVALIGANGAGKTSALKAICRLIPSSARKLDYSGIDLRRSRVHELPRRGLVMGVPLLVVGVSEGALLPRAGAWMTGVRRFFGVLLLGVAIWVLSPVLPPMAQMLAWAALFIGAAIFLRALDAVPAGASGWWRLWKALGIVALVIGVALLVGALSGSRDPLRPLAALSGGGAPAQAPVPWQRVASLQDLQERLKAPGKPVMLDFYADWCVSCKEMESFTFSDPKVRVQLDGMLLLQADVTAHNEADRALLKRFSLFGPPGIVFFDAQGREIRGLRVIGYQNPERFLKTLSLATAP